MKVTSHTVIKIELEPGDNNYALYDEIGDLHGDSTVSIVDGAIEIILKEDE